MLPPEAYNHFMLLHCAVTICSSEVFLKFIEIDESRFEIYVQMFAEVYGAENLTYTVLDSYSAFPFESMLGQIKSHLRSGNKNFGKEGVNKIKKLASHGLKRLVKTDHPFSG